jgi:hypothetical protein
MKRYEFTITLSGEGNNAQEAWEDAVEAFQLDPGAPPDSYALSSPNEEPA